MSQVPTARHAQQDWGSSIIAPSVAGLATVCSATALTGVIEGWSWLSYIVVAVVLVVCTGLALRSLRTPALVVGLGQILVLLLLITGMFTSSGILAIIPGPAAFAELNEVLTAAGEQIRTGLPPVTASAPILCLATIGIGLVAVLVDTIAVTVAAPAASGLVLLCLYAVPASLAEDLLPWWTFVLGAGTFAVLIALDNSHRHRGWQGSGGRQHVREMAAMSSTPSVVVSVAIVCGLLAGATVTSIGTVGQLPFNAGSGNRGPSAAGLGLQPFTELQGLLNQQQDIELFRVRGLGDDQRLMRAFTLDTYAPNEGWRLRPGPMPAGVVASDRLPRAPGDDDYSRARAIRIDPVHWRDVWLPIYGKPREITGIDDNWYYDQVSGTIYTERAQQPPTYTVSTSLPQPTKDELQDASATTGEIPAIYSAPPPIDPRVQQLTDQIVAGETTAYGKAQALWRFFIDDGNFTYDTETASNAGTNALAHFLLEGKRGYCAQFASAMAVMLRSEGIGARVAIGFTSGKRMNGYNAISTKDAHAWVEVYFGPEHGWVAFDPTPLDDGRGVVPEYLEQDVTTNPDTGPEDRASGLDQPQSTPTPTPEPQEQDKKSQDKDTVSLAQAPDWVRWPVLLLVLIATWLTAATIYVTRRTSELRSHPDADAGTPLVRRLALARWWLPHATAAGWLLSLALVGWMVSWLLAIALFVVAGALVAPALLREYHRGSRLHDILLGRPDAASAAWRELLDELADRGTPVAEAETVRDTARRLAADYGLDDEGKRHLDTIVRVLERSWYGDRTDVDPELAAAFEGLRQSLNQAAPLSWQGKLLPTSVMSGLPGRRS